LILELDLTFEARHFKLIYFDGFTTKLINISNSIGTIFIIDGNTLSFVYENACSEDSTLSGKQLKIDLNITIEGCDNKQFEDGDCFDFMDEEAYDFEG
jgi:hypothetical protein